MILQACKKAVVFAKENFPSGEISEFLLVTLYCNEVCVELYAMKSVYENKDNYAQQLRYCVVDGCIILTCPGYTYHLVHVQTSADTAALAFAKQHECDELRVRDRSFVVLIHEMSLISDHGLAPCCRSSCNTPRVATLRYCVHC